jgi:hypothetical protein
MANPGVAVPGSVVATGSQVSPAGPQGIQGPSTVSANANNKATLGSDSLVLVQGTAAGVAATTHAQTVSGDDPQLTNARTPTAHEASHVTGSDQIPLASASTKGLLNQTSGNTTDFIDGTNNSQPLQPVIWSATRRVFNAIGNPTFEVDQRNAGNALTNPGAGVFVCDRFFKAGGGTYQITTQTPAQAIGGGSANVLPGTNFRLSAKFLSITLNTQESSLAAADVLAIRQVPEGIRFRELCQDVHSVSILIQSSTAPLKFGFFLRDAGATRSLTKLCTYTGPGWQLITLPNLPVWPTAGSYSILPGNQGYDFGLCFACGSTSMSPANDVWQNGNFVGAVGQDNWCANPVNSTIFVGFLQHEPGAQCTTPIDCPFQQNYDDCLRYFTKSYPYTVATGSVGGSGAFNMMFAAAGNPYLYVPFKKTMAKTPTVVGYSQTSGAANVVRDVSASADKAITSVVNTSDAGFGGFVITSPNAAVWQGQFHYSSDTGW